MRTRHHEAGGDCGPGCWRERLRARGHRKPELTAGTAAGENGFGHEGTTKPEVTAGAGAGENCFGRQGANKRNKPELTTGTGACEHGCGHEGTAQQGVTAGTGAGEHYKFQQNIYIIVNKRNIFLHDHVPGDMVACTPCPRGHGCASID